MFVLHATSRMLSWWLVTFCPFNDNLTEQHWHQLHTLTIITIVFGHSWIWHHRHNHHHHHHIITIITCISITIIYTYVPLQLNPLSWLWAAVASSTLDISTNAKSFELINIIHLLWTFDSIGITIITISTIVILEERCSQWLFRTAQTMWSYHQL